MQVSLPAVALCALLLLATASAAPKPYVRKPPAKALPLTHPLLARQPAANNAVEGDAPEQVHLSFAGPGAYTVSWVTHPHLAADFAARAAAARAAAQEAGASLGSGRGGGSTSSSSSSLERGRAGDACAAMQALGLRSVVVFGFYPGEYTFEAEGWFNCYSTEDYQSGALHHAVIGDGAEGPLPPNTRVYYRVGDPTRATSQEFSFMTSPETGAAGLPYKLGVVGDLGQTEHSVTTLEHVYMNQAQSCVMVGDLSYADGDQPRWDAWRRLMQPHASSQVWMYTEGNHERERTNGVKDYVAYTSRFFQPHRQSGSSSPLYYSYDVAGIHVIMAGSYAEFEKGSEQYAWLERDLAAVDRERTPWVVAAMHAPWYNSNHNHHGEGEAMRLAMEGLFYQYGVDLVLAGHVHAYESSARVFDNRLDECGPMYFNIGDGGNTEEGLDRDFFSPQPEWSAFRESSYGHAMLHFHNATHAEWLWNRNQDDVSEVAHQVMIVRNPDCKAHLAKGGATKASHQGLSQQPGEQQEQQPAAQVLRRARKWAGHVGGLLHAAADKLAAATE